MEIIANNLRVLEHGCLVLAKDSVIDFQLDSNLCFSIKFVSIANEQSKISVSDTQKDHVTIQCINFAKPGLSQGLMKPFSVLKLSSGGHIYLQFAVSGVGMSMIFFYTWYTEVRTNSSDNDDMETPSFTHSAPE